MSHPNEPGWADPLTQQPYSPQLHAGQPYPGQPYPGQLYGWPGYGYGPAPQNGPGTAGLTLGLVALCTFWIPVLSFVGALPCAILAIVQGTKGRKLAAAGWATNGGKAQAGVVCGIIALVLCALSFVYDIWLSMQLP